MKKRLIFVFSVAAILASVLFVGCTKKEPAVWGKPIGIIGAMDSEVNSLKESAHITVTAKIAEMEFCVGKLGSKDVVIVKCGMGKVNAGICAHTLVHYFGCTKIINTGVAGSLDGRLDIGDIVVSTDAVQHDFDVSPIGFKKGEIPYTGRYSFPADETLRKAAVNAVAKAANEVKFFEGRVCSGDQFIFMKEQKQRIINEFGGMCCEMEGGAIAQVCWLNKTPFVIIRAISDKQDGTAPDEYHTFEALSAARCAKIVQYMVKNM
ncbi:MAG: 5'-methylthioadenosine/adenosylhomocysteine nucleosidase [Spirochaetales bacterium]|nr:5'-methylthioadenosine/adenosylhomocysteine nucleosidase [Spirochaetales bacterium]